MYLFFENLLINNLTYFANSAIFLVAVIAILKKLHSTITRSGQIPNNYITSFLALLGTVSIILFTTLMIIGSSDVLKWQFGFLVWLVYISAILIIFTIVEALFSFEQIVVNKNHNTSGLAIMSGVIFSIIYDIASAAIIFDVITRLDLSRGLTAYDRVHYSGKLNKLGSSSLFNHITFGFSISPKIYVYSGVLQGLALAIVVRILRLK